MKDEIPLERHLIAIAASAEVSVLTVRRAYRNSSRTHRNNLRAIIQAARELRLPEPKVSEQDRAA
jgi:DNA-binding LacI/PurR family transcriptional regulator